MPDDPRPQELNLLLVTHYYSGRGGGIELVARELAMRLAANHGFHITWAASDVDEPFAAPGIEASPMRTWNPTEPRIGVPYPLWGPRSVLRLRQLTARADVVQVHDCLYFGSVAASLFARRWGRPVLVTQHIGLVPYRSRVLRWTMEAANRVCGRIVLGRADRVVYISRIVRDYFLERVRHRGQDQLIPNGVDTAVFNCPSQDARRQARDRLQLDADRPVCLFVGRFVEKKGLDLVRAMAGTLRHVTWLMAGQGPMDPDDWGLGNIRVFRGRSGESLAPLYRAADLLVLPSLGEGFPLVVGESLACGTAAAVSTATFEAALDDVRPLLYHQGVDPCGRGETAVRWTKFIETLLSDVTGLRRRGAEAAGVAAGHWSWDLCAARYAEALRHLAGRGRRGAARGS
jgi:phosphatidylinositol alpha-1,6-mannosyltransferase